MMRLGAHLVVILIAALLPAVASAAQSGSAQVLPQSIADFAQCVVKRHRDEASDYVLRRTSRPWQVTSSAERRLGDSHCIPPTISREDGRLLLKMHEKEQLRPAFAEALVRNEFPTADASVIITAQPLDYGKLVDSLWPPDACKNCRGQQLKDFENARARSAALMAPLIFGECIVRTDPANAHKLLMTLPASAEETSVIGALQPSFSNCVAEGQQLSTTRSVVRDVVALNYYRLARAPRVQPAAEVTK